MKTKANFFDGFGRCRYYEFPGLSLKDVQPNGLCPISHSFGYKTEFDIPMRHGLIYDNLTGDYYDSTYELH